MRAAVLYVGMAAFMLSAVFSRQALALPTMIRLGYPNCASCHISPQGGGLLNAYGRSIDQAQSMRGGEYQPSDNRLAQALSWGGRVTQDFRVVSQELVSSGTGLPVLGRLRSRFMYRNSTELGRGFRVSATVVGENDSAPRPTLRYESGIRPAEVYLGSALFSYRPRDSLEFSVGRDVLPSGVYVSDVTPFIKSRNRMGFYDTPTQVKMAWWGKHYQFIPYAFGPSGNERRGQGERGGGALAEVDVFGKQRTVLGVNVLRGSALDGDRRLMGGYARLGFGKWGILAEHDITDRTLRRPTAAAFRQHATYAQVFWAIREWLVASLIGEHLGVGGPFHEDLNAAKIEVVARLSSQFTIGVNTRLQRNMVNGALAPSAAVQLAMKTVN